MGIPGQVEGTNPVEGSRIASESSHEAGKLAGLQGQNAGSVGDGSIGGSTVVAETSGDRADEVAVAETAAVVAVAVGFADSAGEFEKEAAAAAGSEVATSTKECRSAEHSAY